MARDRGVVFHCDAVQALGKVPFDVNEIAVFQAERNVTESNYTLTLRGFEAPPLE